MEIYNTKEGIWKVAFVRSAGGEQGGGERAEVDFSKAAREHPLPHLSHTPMMAGYHW